MSLPISSLFTAAAALLAVLALVVLAGRGARLTGLGRPGRAARLEVRDTLALDRARRLHVVRCDGRDLLLLTGGGSDLVVGWLPAPGIAGDAP